MKFRCSGPAELASPYRHLPQHPSSTKFSTKCLYNNLAINTAQRSRVQAAAMKLLTHNFLQCHVKGVKNGYPLKIEAAKIEQRDADYDPDFLRTMYKRIDWKAFVEGAQALGCGDGLPADVTEELLQDDAFLQKFHHALLEDGALICPETGRRFPVVNGIPNMLLAEDEV